MVRIRVRIRIKIIRTPKVMIIPLCIMNARAINLQVGCLVEAFVTVWLWLWLWLTIQGEITIRALTDETQVLQATKDKIIFGNIYSTIQNAAET